jgi:hypothetical protein
MLKRVCSTLAVLALVSVVPGLAAQELAETPQVISVLEAREPGEIRFRMTNAQLEEEVGIPEIAYTDEDRVVADLAEVGLLIERHGTALKGDVKAALGRVKFRSTRLPDGRVRLQYELPNKRGTLTLLVNRGEQTAEVSYPAGTRINAADRFVFRALAVALARTLREDSPEADLLLRAARLWGDHPLQEVRLKRIQAPVEKSWTNLCGSSSRSLAHDGGSHGLINETLAVGPNASNCRSRCGAGCNAILGTSAWTVDCGEHDRCEQHHSCCAACQDEFNSASDDFLFAPNCRLSGW